MLLQLLHAEEENEVSEAKKSLENLLTSAPGATADAFVRHVKIGTPEEKSKAIEFFNNAMNTLAKTGKISVENEKKLISAVKRVRENFSENFL